MAWWPWVRILRSSQEEEEGRWTGDAQQLVLCSGSRGPPRLPRNKEHKGAALRYRVQEGSEQALLFGLQCKERVQPELF